MLILLSWIRDFVEIAESPRELAHALTMAGMAVDAIEDVDGDTVFEFDITSNRPDAMNHFGIAREVASVYGRPLQRPAIPVTECPIPASTRATVEIEDTDSCVRYVGRVFEDVRVQAAPDWMRRRLELCGVRSINNLADLTNYVLLEMGQPTHAFDLDTLEGRQIVVRRAIRGESLVTLDGERRDLTPDQLAICDLRQPVALAGVMGGAATEITSETRNVLLEAAWFRPAMVRNASRRFKLFTEASHRFERGADWAGAVWAADRIASLLGQTGRGTVLRGRIDCYPQPRSLPTIQLERDRIRRLLGVSVGDADVEAILTSLGFHPVADGAGWSVPAVSHRLDVEREVDLIEEIARIYGFERIPGRFLSWRCACPGTARRGGRADARRRARSRLRRDDRILVHLIEGIAALRERPRHQAAQPPLTPVGCHAELLRADDGPGPGMELETQPADRPPSGVRPHVREVGRRLPRAASSDLGRERNGADRQIGMISRDRSATTT